MRQRDERGAVLPIMAAMVTVLVLIAAMAVDLGMQRVARRDMQAIADVVALDLARLLDGRSAGDIKAGSGGKAALEAAKAASFARNNDSLFGDAPAGCTDGACVGAYLVDLDLAGKYPMNNGVPVEVAANVVPDGVVVQASTEVAFAFAGIVGLDKGEASRSGVAATEKTACFKLGSYAAAIRSGDSSLLAPLNSFLGLNLSLLSYQNLAGANVTLAELVATGQVGTTDQLLSSSMTLGQFRAATLAALNNQSPRNTAAITALQGLIAANVNQTRPLRVGDVINVDPTDAAALTTRLNVLDVLTGAAMVANGDSAVSISGLTAGTATVGGVTINTLKVTERARTACGTVGNAPSIAACAAATNPLPRGCAQNSQLRGSATIPLTLANTAVGTSFFKVSTAGSQLVFNLGNAVGILSNPEPSCGAGTTASPDTVHVSLATSAATASLTTGLHFETNALNLGVLVGSVIVSADVTLSSTIPTPAPTGSASLINPPNQTTPVSTGSDVRLSPLSAQPTVSLTIRPAGGGLPLVGSLLATATSLLNSIYGITTTTATAAVNAVVNGPMTALVTSLNTVLLGPLATLLGLDVAGADVFMVDRPTCQTPKLVG